MNQRAFTLVELSIVLVILGLLVGGVLTGQSLIRAAELRSVLTDNTRFITASNAFRDKYFAIPGDIGNATSFWGILAGTGSDATCQGTVATGLPTCNGNGDGLLTAGSGEAYRFWQHLANAGLIEGRYAGVSSLGDVSGNVPMSKIGAGAAWTVFYRTALAGSANWFAVSASHVLMLTHPSAAILKPEDAWNIDTKQDDGLPGTGKIIVYKDTTGSCTTATNTAPPSDVGATYMLSATNKECKAMYWQNAF